MLLFIGSCRKDAKLSDGSNLADVQDRVSRPVISNAEINNWFDKNPVGKYIKVDWSKARQSVISGVSVVTVPVKRMVMPSANQISAGQQFGLKTAATGADSLMARNFDPYHPPALYFFKGQGATPADTVKALMLNFVPDDPTKEGGARGIWTGKLMEWNMQGTKIFYQALSKSVVTDKYAMDVADAIHNASTAPVNGAALQTNSFFGDILDALKWVTDAVYNLIGGPILAYHQANPNAYHNACALRVSRALNDSGNIIPAVNGTEKGADGKNYFLSAKSLNAYLKRAFEAPTYHFNKAQGGSHGENFPALLNGLKGIYSMISTNHYGRVVMLICTTDPFVIEAVILMGQ